MPTRRVAIVGGGITGAVAASALAPVCEVHVYDQGRRGSGRPRVAPHGRSVHTRRAGHGRTTARRARIRPWLPVFAGGRRARARLPSGSTAASALPARPLWHGRRRRVALFRLVHERRARLRGGWRDAQVPRRVLEASGATVHAGVRVSGLRRVAAADGGPPQWALLGVGGAAAFHDTAEAVAAATEAAALGAPFDAVLLTDVSSSFASWHRASAGVPESLAARVRERARVPLFAAMVAFAEPLGARRHQLWRWRAGFGGRAAPRAARPRERRGGALDAFVSTPAFAVR